MVAATRTGFVHQQPCRASGPAFEILVFLTVRLIIAIHLLLPLAASLLFVLGMLFIKRAAENGATPWTTTFLANQWAALVFSAFWFLPGEDPSSSQLWQPTIIAALYILGQVFTFSAIEHGDVSVATPVFGIKVLLVAIVVSAVLGERLPSVVWTAAGLATLGIAMVQYRPSVLSPVSGRRRAVYSVVLAILAATAFTFFDVCVQSWAPEWSARRLLPISFWIAGLLSIGFLPFAQPKLLLEQSTRVPLLLGTLCVALQALCIVFTLATFGDAARVNVVYAMRGIWGVVLAWIVASRWGGNEATLPKRVMLARLVGAGLLTTAAMMVVLAGD